MTCVDHTFSFFRKESETEGHRCGDGSHMGGEKEGGRSAGRKINERGGAGGGQEDAAKREEQDYPP